MNKLKRIENESEWGYISRLYRDGMELNLKSKEINEIVNKELDKDYAESTTRCNAKIWNLSRQETIDEFVNANESSNDEYLKELEEKKLEIEKERKKLQSVKVEYNKILREAGREELWWENLNEAVNNLFEFEVPTLLHKEKLNKDGLLIISDCHYGRQCKIKGLYGEIISEYNTDIFKDRMWDLYNQVIESCEDRGLNHLNIFNLGDFIDGLLRLSQLNSLQLGVVDSVLEYSEFLATWLNKLSSYITIDYYQTQGNHDEVRILTGKKGDFPHENVSKLIIKFIELRLKGNPNITIHESETDFVYLNILGVNVMGYHGEDKNLTNAIRYFKSLYNQPIDLLFGGHLHSQSLITEGIGSYGDTQCIRVSGICGIDDYSVKLKKSARAGASMFIFKEGKGKISQEDFWLN